MARRAHAANFIKAIQTRTGPQCTTLTHISGYLSPTASLVFFLFLRGWQERPETP